MAMDIVDIGGAAREGVPNIPPPRDADGDDEDAAELFTLPAQRDNTPIPDAVKKSVVPGADVAYPNTHPAVASGLESDADGRIIVPKGKTITPKSVLTKPRPGVRDKAREKSAQELDALLAQEDTAEPTASAGSIARSEGGTPLIEVIFHTEIGSIVSYFQKVVQSGNWLVLVSDTKAPANAKFIPRPKDDLQEGEKPRVFDMSITGADRQTQELRAVPLGIQFAVDDYDFVIMMIAEDEE